MNYYLKRERGNSDLSSYSTNQMEISSHQQTHVHVDKTSPVARVNVMHKCVVVELENGDQLYLHISNEAIQQIAAKATEQWES